MLRTSKTDESGTYESFEKVWIALRERRLLNRSRSDQKSRKFFAFSIACGFGKSISRTRPNVHPEPRAAASALARACAVRWLKNLLPMPWRGRARSPAVPANGGSVVTGVTDV